VRRRRRSRSPQGSGDYQLRSRARLSARPKGIRLECGCDGPQGLLFIGLPDKEIKRITADMTEVTHPAGKELLVEGHQRRGVPRHPRGWGRRHHPGGRPPA
jgi:hypothetical protein